MDPYRLDEKSIIVTGASSGIGKATSIFLSEMGAKVILVGRNESKLRDTLSQMKNKDSHLIEVFDFNAKNDVNKWLKLLVKDLGAKIDGIVHAAGIHKFTPLRSINSEDLDALIETNVLSTIKLVGAFSKKNVSNDHSSIVLISSTSGIVGEPGVVGYSATKGAINSIVKSSAVELAKRKIRVNSVVPGIVETEMSQQISDKVGEEQFNSISNKHLLGLGQPEDIAYSICYLLSGASKWITGTSLIIDGGYTCR